MARVYAKQWQRMAATCAIATSLTNLAMNAFLPSWAASVFSFLVMGGTAALLIEAFVYYRMDSERRLGIALVASALANTASFTLGILAAPWLFR